MHELLLFTACRIMHAYCVTIYSLQNNAYIALLLFTACTIMHP